MGKGAFLNVKNNNSGLMKIQVDGTNCMYGTGSWGDLIPAGDIYPRQYIEAKASGIPCCCKHSSVGYSFSILDPKTGKFEHVGSISLYEKDNTWTISGTSENVGATTTAGDQYTIDITVNTPSKVLEEVELRTSQWFLNKVK